MIRLCDIKEAYQADDIRYHQKGDEPYEVYVKKGDARRKYEIDVQTVEELFEQLMERVQLEKP